MKYDKAFYNDFEDSTKHAAELILPYIIEWVHPGSIVDFGCGEGMWLNIAKKINPSIDICGLDGEYICIDELKIDSHYFVPTDLTRKIDLGRKFDLAISLEVGEHLSEEYADVYIDNITRHADRILFSAAIPEQGGVHHVNERWQSYWIKKFVSRGYYEDYSLRNYFWTNESITPWRRQNLIFFTRYKEDFDNARLQDGNVMDVVHPEMYLIKCKQSVTMLDIKSTYLAIDKVINELINKNINQIVICPYGNHGFLCKEILNNKYHINELAILDNNLCLTNSKIFPCKHLKKLQGNYYVIENSWNKDIRTELLNELRKYVPDGRIISIFDKK